MGNEGKMGIFWAYGGASSGAPSPAGGGLLAELRLALLRPDSILLQSPVHCCSPVYWLIFIAELGVRFCAYRPQKKATTTSKKNKPPPKADASATVELLDFRVQNSVIIRRRTREIAHQPSIESSGTSPDPTRLNAAGLLFYFSVKIEVK